MNDDIIINEYFVHKNNCGKGEVIVLKHNASFEDWIKMIKFSD